MVKSNQPYNPTFECVLYVKYGHPWTSARSIANVDGGLRAMLCNILLVLLTSLFWGIFQPSTRLFPHLNKLKLSTHAWIRTFNEWLEYKLYYMQQKCFNIFVFVTEYQKFWYLADYWDLIDSIEYIWL